MQYIKIADTFYYADKGPPTKQAPIGSPYIDLNNGQLYFKTPGMWVTIGKKDLDVGDRWPKEEGKE